MNGKGPTGAYDAGGICKNSTCSRYGPLPEGGDREHAVSLHALRRGRRRVVVRRVFFGGGCLDGLRVFGQRRLHGRRDQSASNRAARPDRSGGDTRRGLAATSRAALSPAQDAWRDRALLPLDRARRALLERALRVDPLRSVVARKEARICARFVFGIAVAFAGAVVAPAALLLFSPLLFGVAHVGADIRYLVRRRGLGRADEAFFFVGCAALLALRAAEICAPLALPYARVELATGAAWIVCAALLSARSTERWDCAAGVGLVSAGLLLLAWPQPDAARVVFAHVHNVVAVVLWLAVFSRGRRTALFSLPLLCAALLAILCGATLPSVVRLGGYRVFGADVFAAAGELAPRIVGPLGPAIVLSYVFLQGVHYMAWLAWIPDSATAAQGTLTFRMTARGLLRDFGTAGTAALAAAALAVLVAALFGASRTRAVYLSLAAFHGYLELAAAAFLIVRAPRGPAASPALV